MKALSSGIAVAILWGTVLLTAQARKSFAQAVTPREPAADIRIVSLGGKRVVEVMPAGATQWKAASAGDALKPGDRIRTREFSTVQLRWSDKSVVRLPELSDVQIQAPAAPKQPASFSLLQGLLYFFNRERLMNARYGTRTASAAIRGTEFILQAEQNGRTTLTVVEGEVELGNEIGTVTLKTGEQGVAEPGQQPRKTPAIIVNNVIQWALYYPAIIDVDELPLTDGERAALADSLHAYQIGELLKALDVYPANRQQASPAEKVYFAGLVLAIGDVEKAEASLDALGTVAGPNRPAPKVTDVADALRLMIATVKRQERPPPSSPQLATEWLAMSYYQQSTGSLRQALQAAYKSVEVAPKFGYGWARVAELEFGYGHTREMSKALDMAMNYSPANPYAMTLKGFVHAARNEMRSAIVWFERAIEIDPGLANARLGRGLSLIRRGDTKRGREDLLIAATLEPQRSIFRSYLAKAYTDAGDEERAEHEIKLAKDLDPNDPTAWLYSALLKEQENRVNEALRDLEKSQELTGNRRIYRSGLLLDQDRAVRSANLARIYHDAGMFDVALREAARGVNYDYANYSAHLFLANAYNELVDPSAVTLRFQTPKRIEYLLANLLAPVGGGILSPAVSEQEYSKLFERDRLGVSSRTEYLSRGAWSEVGSQFGISGNNSYALEAYYQVDPGQRVNNDFDQREFVLHAKQAVSPTDALYVLASRVDAEGGDLAQRYNPSSADPDVRFTVKQEPTIVLGYHHEWIPGSQTLLMGTIYKDDFRFRDPTRPLIIVSRVFGEFEGVPIITNANKLEVETDAYAAEAQHILTGPRYHTIIGARYVWGDSRAKSRQDNPSDLQPFFPDPPQPMALQRETLESDRFSAYVYQQLEIVDALRVFGGLTYDDLRFPVNLLDAPISAQRDRITQWSPKAGLIWTPKLNTVVRFAYTRSLIGRAVDQNLLIEPSQVAGFTQIYRSIFPESMVGSVPGAKAETLDLSIEQKLGANTFLGLTGEILTSKAQRTRGAFDLFPLEEPFGIPSSLQERLDYRERSISATVDQLIAYDWSLGLRYRVSEAELRQDFPAIPHRFLSGMDVESTLHQLSVRLRYNHTSGIFALLDGVWNVQSNHGYNPEQQGDNFWQFNAVAGYRFYHKRVEIAAGALNLFDQDYRLSPLNLHPNLPRERTFVARVTFAF